VARWDADVTVLISMTASRIHIGARFDENASHIVNPV